MHRGLTWIAGILLLVLVLIPGDPSFGQEEIPGWSEPIALSSRLPSSWFPDLAVDETGRVHVVWSTVSGAPRASTQEFEREGHDVVMYAVSEDGTEWAEPADILALPQDSGSHATRPTLLLEEDRIAHLMFRTSVMFYTQVPLGSIDDPQAWSPHTQISVGNAAYYSDMALDSQGVLHSVFTQNVPSPDCALCYHLLYRRSEDHGKTWSPVDDISLLSIGSAKPEMLIDSDDKIHVVWESGRGGGLGMLENPVTVSYISSDDGGDTWGLPLELPSPNGQGRNVAIGQTGDGDLIITWLSLPDLRIHYQISSDRGQSWSRPRAIDGFLGYDTRLDRYTIATDSAGNVHFVFVGRSTETRVGLQLIHLTWKPADAAWVDPEIIVAETGDVPEWPQLEISAGNRLHLVWFVRDRYHVFDSENGRYQVWYTQTQVDAPAEAFAQRPTASPTTEPTPTTTPIPPTPRPTLNPLILDSSSDARPVDSEAAALTLLAGSLLPALVLMAAVVIGIRIWRR
jgi:hypothetical protein